jgi:membrane-associated phospholipid phosphatase
MYFRYCFVVGLLLGVHQLSHAQRDTHAPEYDYLKSYVTDVGSISTQPLRWQKKEWFMALGTATVFTTIYLNDLPIQDFFQANKSESSIWFSTHIAEPLGSGLITLPALGLLYGSGWAFDNPKSRQVALQAGKAWVLTAGATAVLKQLAHRQRPNEGEYPNPHIWRGPFALTKDYTSFPSGHTSTAFAVATVVADSYADKWYIGAASYALASVAGISRIHDNKHWASDVFAGAVLGFWVGRSVSRLHPAVQWGANISGRSYSGTLVWRF